MAYVWQTSITSGNIAKKDFYNSISSTYTEVMNSHCPSNHTGYDSSVYSNKTDNSSVTSCSANDTSDKSGNNTSYTCSSDKATYYATDYTSNDSYYSSNLSTNKSSNKTSNYTSNLTSDDTDDSDK